MVQGLGKEIPHGFLRSAAAHVLLQRALQQAGGAGVLPGPARCARRPQQAAHVQAPAMPGLDVGAQLQRDLHAGTLHGLSIACCQQKVAAEPWRLSGLVPRVGLPAAPRNPERAAHV